MFGLLVLQERTVAVGDLHGDLMRSRELLKFVGVMNDQEHWCGGNTYLVQTGSILSLIQNYLFFILIGDVVDRGPHSYEITKLLWKLQEEAQDQGGHVVLLLGDFFSTNIFLLLIIQEIMRSCLCRGITDI